jgi:hypothetical protein
MQAGNWRRSIWFYCGTEEIRRALENRFKRTLSKENVVSSASAEGETSKRYLCVSPLENSKVKSAPDQKWFLSVFEVLGLASK